MAVDAFLESVVDPETGEEAVRIRFGESKSDQGTQGVVHAISAHSVLIEAHIPIELGGRIDVRVPHAGSRNATVQWVSGYLFSCQFDSALSSATLSAAALKGALVQHNILGALISERVIESFGARLQRLRTEKRLTQADVAAALRVSEPSVSAWELNKARPLAGRLDELAHVLGVSTSQLVANNRDGDLPVEVVTHSRAQIASAFGVHPDQVKISVEM